MSEKPQITVKCGDSNVEEWDGATSIVFEQLKPDASVLMIPLGENIRTKNDENFMKVATLKVLATMTEILAYDPISPALTIDTVADVIESVEVIIHYTDSMRKV